MFITSNNKMRGKQNTGNHDQDEKCVHPHPECTGQAVPQSSSGKSRFRLPKSRIASSEIKKSATEKKQMNQPFLLFFHLFSL